MLNLSCENELYLHEKEKSWAYQRLRHRRNKTNKISGKELNKKWDKTNRTQKSDKKSKDIVGQKNTQRDRARRHRTVNWDKKSDGKTRQKIGHINSDKIVGQNSRTQKSNKTSDKISSKNIEQKIGQRIGQDSRTKKSNKASHKFGQKIGQKNRLKAVEKFRQKIGQRNRTRHRTINSDKKSDGKKRQKKSDLLFACNFLA